MTSPGCAAAARVEARERVASAFLVTTKRSSEGPPFRRGYPMCPTPNRDGPATDLCPIRDRLTAGRFAYANRSRSPSGTATAGRRRVGRSRPPGAHRRGSGGPRQARPAALASAPGALADAHEVGRRRRQPDPGRVEDQLRRIGHDGDLASGQCREGGANRGRHAAAGSLRRGPGRRTGGSRWRLARCRASDAAKSRRSLRRERADHDAPHAHRPGPGERLGVDASAEDEDRACPPDVEAERTHVAVAARRRPRADREPGRRPPARPSIAAPATWQRDADAGR